MDDDPAEDKALRGDSVLPPRQQALNRSDALF